MAKAGTWAEEMFRGGSVWRRKAGASRSLRLVRAPDHLGDPLRFVVNHYRRLVGETAVRTQHDKITVRIVSNTPGERPRSVANADAACAGIGRTARFTARATAGIG